MKQVKTSGELVVKYSYDSFGVPKEYLYNSITQAWEEKPVGTFGNPYLYKGYYYDTETGLYYLNARYYDPTIGRFLSKDPNGASEKDRLEQNPYLYAKNNPVNSEDPSGLKSAYWWYRHNKYLYAKTGKLRYKARMGRWYNIWQKSAKRDINKAAYWKGANQKRANRATAKSTQALEKNDIKGYLKYNDQASSYQQKVNYWGNKLTQAKRTYRRNVNYNIHDGRPDPRKGETDKDAKGTYKWARERGFTPEQARIIAEGCTSVDSGKMKNETGRHRNTAILNWFGNIVYPFGAPYPTSQEYWTNRELRTAIKNSDLKALGRGLHSVQDEIKHGQGPYPFDRHALEVFGGPNPDRYVSEDELEEVTKAYLQRYLGATR